MNISETLPSLHERSCKGSKPGSSMNQEGSKPKLSKERRCEIVSPCVCATLDPATKNGTLKILVSLMCVEAGILCCLSNDADEISSKLNPRLSGGDKLQPRLRQPIAALPARSTAYRVAAWCFLPISLAESQGSLAIASSDQRPHTRALLGHILSIPGL